MYVLEVVKFTPDKKDGKREHVGYMQKIFETPVDACLYYNTHNTHLRKLNAQNTWRSDWDPKTNLMYIVRKDYLLTATIPPFKKN